MKEITFQELLEMFDPEVHEAIKASYEKGTGMVVFENVDFCSSQLGQRSALRVGPGCTYKTVEETEGQWLNDLPSERQYPQCYCKKEI